MQIGNSITQTYPKPEVPPNLEEQREARIEEKRVEDAKIAEDDKAARAKKADEEKQLSEANKELQKEKDLNFIASTQTTDLLNALRESQNESPAYKQQMINIYRDMDKLI